MLQQYHRAISGRQAGICKRVRSRVDCSSFIYTRRLGWKASKVGRYYYKGAWRGWALARIRNRHLSEPSRVQSHHPAGCADVVHCCCATPRPARTKSTAYLHPCRTFVWIMDDSWFQILCTAACSPSVCGIHTSFKTRITRDPYSSSIIPGSVHYLLSRVLRVPLRTPRWFKWLTSNSTCVLSPGFEPQMGRTFDFICNNQKIYIFNC